MQLDHRTAMSRRPAPGALLEAFEDRHIVQWAKAAGAEKCSPIGTRKPIQPESPYREWWSCTACGYPLTPGLGHRAVKSQTARRRRIGRNDDRRGINLGAGLQPNPWKVLAGVEPRNTLASPHLDAELLQIAPQRRPEAAVVV